MTLHWPQAIMLVFLLLDVGVHLARNGEPRKYPYSFGAALANFAIVMALLYWGGFFS